jgi:hypothetical protein
MASCIGEPIATKNLSNHSKSSPVQSSHSERGAEGGTSGERDGLQFGPAASRWLWRQVYRMTLGYPMSTALAAASHKRRDWRPTRLGNLGRTSRRVFPFKASSQIQALSPQDQAPVSVATRSSFKQQIDLCQLHASAGALPRVSCRTTRRRGFLSVDLIAKPGQRRRT